MHDLDRSKLPAHVAIIMDGNGRWARLRNLPRVEGHVQGIESVRDIVTTTRELNIPYLTLYAFSKENWGRPRAEVARLLELLAIYLDRELQLMLDKSIRFNVIGEMDDFPKRLQRHLMETMDKTRKNKGLTLSIALSYSGRREILKAVRAVCDEMLQGKVRRIDERVFRRHLFTRDIPDPDLLIRTSGEMRLSNFLLWQMAYTEFYITDTLWPDFRRDAYIKALSEFTKRDRRFGGVKGS